jgi:hypothetical protein
MGSKITIDSASMMNKGLEVIEAKHFFSVDIDRIEVQIHPQSIIHSMVEYVDGSVIAQLGVPDMRIPIAYALSYPERLRSSGSFLDLLKVGRLDFICPDLKKSKPEACLRCGQSGWNDARCFECGKRSCRNIILKRGHSLYGYAKADSGGSFLSSNERSTRHS